ncbi:DNA cytosine methyltransferase [Ramlibacter sp. MAHUQ-53]|uniref:DNA cytosine methyltransferase n=1 Tax=unclassified Ramlibacter TaxID=2617605 RepID=UPI003626435B
MNELALFAGAGGGILGGHLLGWRTVCAVEWEPYAASVLVARQNDGLLPPFPIWDDVQTFDGKPWRGIVDVVSGGFPCQDISIAGKGAGLDGERSGMWKHMARVVGEVRPRYVFVENSPMLIHRGLDRVLGDLAALGYDAKWTVMGAADVGAPHQRDRLWVVAHAHSVRQLQPQGSQQDQRGRSGDCCDETHVADSQRGIVQVGREYAGMGRLKELGSQGIAGDGYWSAEPDVGRMADGIPARLDRLKALGNGQVPLCAATAFELLAA